MVMLFDDLNGIILDKLVVDLCLFDLSVYFSYICVHFTLHLLPPQFGIY